MSNLTASPLARDSHPAMPEPRQPSSRPQFRLWHYALGAALLWTAFIAATAGWSMFERQRGVLASARHEARISFQPEMLSQFWMMGHGDSTPATDSALPSPALARTAKRALFDSAAMLRQIQGRSPEPAGYRGRLVSVKPLRPENAPDAWESAALQAFAKGETEVASVAAVEGQEYMRVMRPLRHEASCIMCHGGQDYKVGDIHGGLSVSVPLAPLRVRDQGALVAQVITDSVIWVLGLGVIGFGARRAQAHNLERAGAETVLRDNEKRYRQLFENALDGVCLADAQTGMILDCNAALLKMVGRAKHEVVGQPQQILHPPSEAIGEVTRSFEQQRGEKAGQTLEVPILTKAGDVQMAEIRASMHEFRGRKTMVGVFRDITARRRMEKVQSCLSQLAYQLSLISDAPQAARLVADTAQDLLGWDACFVRLSSLDQARMPYVFHMDTVGGRRVEVPASSLSAPPGPMEERVMRDGAQIILRSSESEGAPGLVPFGNTGRRSASLLFVPLRPRGQHIGLFSIQSYRVGAYDRAALELLQVLADQAAGALARIWTEQELESVHQQLVEASRRGGMAEIATNVLHNVGNVLNSVNISTGLIVQSVKQSKTSSLARVVTLLQEHAHDLGAFITHDSRGKHVPAHLAQLAEHLQAEQEGNLHELESLQRNVEHIKQIVAMQQNYATFGGVKEIINVVDLVEDSLRLNERALSRHEVQLIREFEPVPPLNVEKHKVLQILVNLLRNAKHACQDAERRDKRLTVRVANGEGRVRISVMDNGVGIPPENLTRIFNHGFTTRKKGHGFGLHSGALAAKELGGSLTVHSDGPGRGAVFTLELPLSDTQELEG